MRDRFLKTLAVAALPLLAAAPAGAAVLNLIDGEYAVKLFNCKEDGSPCTGTLNVFGGAVTGAFVPVGDQDTLSAPAQINEQLESRIAFSLPGGGNLFWGAIGYYDGLYTFLPPETMTWAVLGNFTTSWTFQTVVGYSLENGPIYGEPQTIYEEVVGGRGGWASIVRTGDPFVPAPKKSGSQDPLSVYLGDVSNLLLPAVQDALGGQPGAITGLQGVSKNLLNLMAQTIRSDQQVIDLPVGFGNPAAVPTPGTLALLAAGVVGLAWARRRDRLGTPHAH